LTARRQRRVRRAARVLVTDACDRVLLFRFTFGARPAFWATPGGECDPGEPYEAAARRELFEETGLDCNPGAPIASRSNDFVTAEGEPVTADERYFRVRVPVCDIATHGHTELERRIMLQHRWFTLAELADWHEPIFPPEMLDLLAREAA
jgi:8-oxo-dGTP pyrophosphatase MutT (NUDIX family)